MCPQPPSSTISKAAMKTHNTHHLRRKQHRPVAILVPSKPKQHRLVKAKMFVHVQEEQPQLQPQRRQAAQTVMMMNHQQHQQEMKASVHVRFDNRVQVTLFEKVSSKYAKDVWYDEYEMALLKADSRARSSSYRKHQELVQAKQETEEVPLSSQQSSKNHHHHHHHDDDYRGYENCTVLRQKQKILANSVAIYASFIGYTPEEIRTVYKRGTVWSKKIAFVQALHDYAEVYTMAHEQHGTTVLPSASSMIPPPNAPSPFALTAAVMVQRYYKQQKLHQREQQKINSNNNTNAIKRSFRSSSPPLLSPTITNVILEPKQQQQQQQQLHELYTIERRVRQRFC